MFFHLFYNSKYFIDEKENDINNKILKTVIYGSIFYILSHGFISNMEHGSKIKNYFWVVLTIDLSSLGFLYIINNNGNVNFNITKDTNIKKISEFKQQMPTNFNFQPSNIENKNKYINKRFNEINTNIETIKQNIENEATINVQASNNIIP